jgi:cytochrome c peroxidase
MRRSSSTRNHVRALLPQVALGIGAALGVAGRADAAASAQAELGRQIFFDTALSASGRLACASCHSPAHAYGPPDGAPVRKGGAGLDQPGLRAVPSLRYVLNRTPVWSKPFISSPTERLLEGDEPPAGGFGWDGRFDTLEAQAASPLLASNEMANRDPEEVTHKLAAAPYAELFKRVFGATIFADPEEAFAGAREALARFELEDPSFHPYRSKYDDYLDGRVSLSAQERRGLTLFDDVRGGSCAACHLDRKGADGSHPLFTDYQFEALGVPRNAQIPANADPDFHDEGLCGPLRNDQSGQKNYCGLFKTPGLRNVATRRVFFHNGRLHTLKEALQFYVRRDTHPSQWYPATGGVLDKFDDQPRNERGNIDVIDAPLTRSVGQAPVWTDAQIDDVIAFLETLTDRDATPAAPDPAADVASPAPSLSVSKLHLQR